MSLYAELKRRNVFRVAVAYIVVSWLMLQIVDVLAELLALPEWAGKLIFVLLLVGFPIALIFAWAFELTPEGLKREHEVDRSASITDVTGRKLDFLIIGVLSIALAWFAWDKFLRQSAPQPEATVTVGATSVAVLPFVAMSSGPDDEFFADGLTEEILNSLAQLPELRVTARTSAFSFKGQDLPVQQIAAVLGVGHIAPASACGLLRSWSAPTTVFTSGRKTSTARRWTRSRSRKRSPKKSRHRWTSCSTKSNVKPCARPVSATSRLSLRTNRGCPGITVPTATPR